MKMGSKAALGLAGLAASLAAGAAVVWGRVRSVDVPQRGEWVGVPEVCAVDPVDRQILGDAIGRLDDHGLRARILPAGTDCTARDGLIAVVVDPELDGWVSADPEEHSPVTWGVTRVSQDGTTIRRALVRLHPSQSETTTTHELVHAMGYDHPFAAPSGHILHPNNPGLKDWRGIP